MLHVGAASLQVLVVFAVFVGWVMTNALDPLFRYLESLRERASLADLKRVVAELDVDAGDVVEFIRFSDRAYTRNLVRGGEWYHVLVLCWKNGQRSPIHDHAGSTCAVRVLRGTLTETLFEFAPHRHVKAVFSRDFGPGSVLGSQDEDMHQVSNLQEGTLDLVTLHVYSPPLLNMRTYSLTDTRCGIEPMFVDFAEAAGI